MRRRTVTFIAPLAVALALLGSVVAGAQNPTPKFTKEDFSAFQAQLNSGQVTAVTFNKKAHSVHVTLKSGELLVASYPPLQYKTISAQIKAKGVPVTIEHVTKAGTTTTTHHKLRYIAAGVLVVVIIVIVLVLGFNRRRPPAEAAAGDAPGAAAPPPSPETPAGE